MIFSSIDFLFFFLVVIIVLKVIESVNENYKKIFLLGASYFFYGYWDWRFLALIIAATIINFVSGDKIYKETVNVSVRKFWLIVSIASSLGILGFFKYYNFFIDSLYAFIPLTNSPLRHLEIILPLGVSFFTFQAMSYTIDIYRNEIKPASALDFFLYIVFFPQLVAGPIVRASYFLPQLQHKIVLSKENFKDGLSLFLIGLFKKSLLADSLSIHVDEIFGNIAMFDGVSLFASIISYSLQIYLDFSGYSDMAIGIGRILGFKLPDNFNKPYRSINITEFWKRWHISLSTWFRDYLYIPLGGNRKGKFRTYFNLSITMGICGLWHGASWTFVFWGIYHGVLLIFHRIYTSILVKKQWVNSTNSPIVIFSSAFITYTLVCVGWVLFRSGNLSNAILVFQKILLWDSGVFWIHISFFLIVPAYFLWTLLPDSEGLKKKYIGFDNYVEMTVTVALVFLILLFSPIGLSPFIYFQF